MRRRETSEEERVTEKGTPNAGRKGFDRRGRKGLRLPSNPYGPLRSQEDGEREDSYCAGALLRVVTLLMRVVCSCFMAKDQGKDFFIVGKSILIKKFGRLSHQGPGGKEGGES